MVDKVRKHFVRIVTENEISRDDIVDFFDVVQSVVPTKVFSSFDGNGNKVKAEVVHYESDDVQVYEVLTEEDITDMKSLHIWLFSKHLAYTTKDVLFNKNNNYNKDNFDFTLY